jgi:hypothetical protein
MHYIGLNVIQSMFYAAGTKYFRHNNILLYINISKCSILSISSKTHQVPRLYYINGISITSNSIIVDLGVTICADLSYQTHITNIVSKARHRSI